MVKRQSLDKTAEGFKAGVDPEANERVDPADAGATTAGASRPHPEPEAVSEVKDPARINPFDTDSDDDSSIDLIDGNGPGAQTFPPCNFVGGSVLEGEEGEEDDAEEGDESRASLHEEASGATAGNSSSSKNATTGPPPALQQPNDGIEGSNNRRSEPAVRKLLGGDAEAEADEEGAAGNKGYAFGFVEKSGDGDGAAADGDSGNFAATAALTPDSVGPGPFSLSLDPNTPRSRGGSRGSEPSASPAPASSLPSSARVERKVSRIAGLLRRFSSSRDMSDPAEEALQLELEPLQIDSDDEYGA